MIGTEHAPAPSPVDLSFTEQVAGRYLPPSPGEAVPALQHTEYHAVEQIAPAPQEVPQLPVASVENAAINPNQAFIPFRKQVENPDLQAKSALSVARDLYRERETERSARFDEALENKDQQTVSAILRDVAEGAFATRNASEHNYLTAKHEAHQSGRPVDAVLRERAFNEAVKAGDEGAINSIIAQAEEAAQKTGNYQYVDDLMDSNDQRRQQQYLLEQRNKRAQRLQEFSLQDNNPESKQAQSAILDKEYTRAQKTGDYRKYKALTEQYFQANPSEWEGATRRAQDLQQAIKAGDKTTVNTILQGVKEFGMPHELRRLKEFLPKETPQSQPKSSERRGRNHRRLGIVLRNLVVGATK